MDQIQILTELRQSLLDEHDQIMAAAETGNRDLTDEQDARLTEIRSEIAATDRKITDAQFIEEQRARQNALVADLSRQGITRHYHTGSGTQGDHSDEDENTLRRFSFLKFIREAGKGQLTGVEKEMHEEAQVEARHNQVEIRNFGIPFALVGKKASEKRDHTAGTDSQGGHTIATELRGFIEVLRDKLVLVELGATYLSGLIGNIAIPRQITKSDPTEKGETATGGEQNITFDQLTLSPKRLPAFGDYSKQLLRQSSQDVERLVINDITSQIALRIQDRAIQGAGSGDEPLGILSTTGIGDVAGGTDGADPAHDHLVDLETEVSVDNADMGSLAYLTNAKVRGKLKKTKIDAGSGLFVWPANENMLNGYNVAVTNTVPSNLTKGTETECSAIIFANWAELMIGQWGGLDVLVNPYTKGKEGLVEIVIDTFYDVGVRHAESFAAMQDALTA